MQDFRRTDINISKATMNARTEAFELEILNLHHQIRILQQQIENLQDKALGEDIQFDALALGQRVTALEAELTVRSHKVDAGLEV